MDFAFGAKSDDHTPQCGKVHAGQPPEQSTEEAKLRYSVYNSLASPFRLVHFPSCGRAKLSTVRNAKYVQTAQVWIEPLYAKPG